jgi:phage-related protein
MKPWQLAKMTRVLKVRTNLVLIFSLQNHYRFLVKSLNWYKITALSFFATVTINATLFSSPFPSSSSKKAQNNAAKLAYNHFSLLSPPLSPFLLLPPLW